ncbi:MAG: hydroxymethylbilane synthase [Lachnospiraceae bacterium]|nr:hydroxymethylbilane synthase [Lachnospiraceae bacterium]
MAYFPMFVNLEGRRCLVIGGGRVAYRKASALVSFGAQLLIVTDQALPELAKLEEREPRVRLLLRPARAEDAEGMDLVVCASDDHELHRKAAAYCREHQIPVNVADDRELSTFLFPGLVRQEDVVVGITTGGNSPAAARYLRQQMEAQIPQYLGKLAKQLGSLRELVKERIPDGKRREQLFSRLFAAGVERNGELPEELVSTMIAEEEQAGKKMKKKIRIGTRKSDLSVAQTMLVVNAMKAAFPDTEFELVCRSTVGDKILDKPLLAFGGKGVFVSEFEEALLRGEIHFAVHSAKDLPTELAQGLEIVGVMPRGDVRDVLVTMNRKGERNGEVIRIGTSSLRRKIQIEALGEKLWPEQAVVCENLRGNVLTRLDKLEQGLYDGIILAAAGLERLDIGNQRPGRYQFHYLSPEEMIPAGGQGILAVEGRKGDAVNEIARAVSDPEAMEALWAERLVLKLLGSGCHEPVGAYCQREGNRLHMTGIYERNGVRRREEIWEFDKEAGRACWELAARRLADRLLGRQSREESKEADGEGNGRADQEYHVQAGKGEY